jgi:pyruvate/2-oxoglutarate dehydrogenase complex dihydrolipoamide acyltransferase (E2) component
VGIAAFGVLGWQGLLATVIAGSASPQGNIDAGKTPAQMFADTCSNCHRRPQELRRTTVGFLRQHYTPGAQEAAAMASYLASLPATADPRAGKERPKAPAEKEKAKAPAPSQQQVQDRPQERPTAQPALTKRAAEVANRRSASRGGGPAGVCPRGPSGGAQARAVRRVGAP